MASAIVAIPRMRIGEYEHFEQVVTSSKKTRASNDDQGSRRRGAFFIGWASFVEVPLR